MDNPFLDLNPPLPDAPTGSNPEPQSGNPYMGMEIDVPDKAPDLAGPTVQSLATTPENFATADRISKASGMPAATLARDPKQAQRIDLQTKLKSIQSGNPELAQWLADGANLPLARDDIGHLSTFSKIVRGYVDTSLRAPASGFVGDFGGSATSGIGRLADIEQRYRRKALQGIFGDTAGDYIDFGLGATPFFGGPQGSGSALQKGGEAVKSFSDQFIAVPQERRNTLTDIGQGLGQVAGYVGLQALTGGTGVVIAGLGQGADQGAQQAQQAGATQGQIDIAAGAGALITSATEKMGIGFLTRRLPEPVKAAMTKRVADILLTGGAEAAQETAEQMLNNVVAMAVYDPKQTLLGGTQQNATVGGAVGLITRSILHLGHDRSAALHDRETLQQMSDTVDATKLSKLSPETMASGIAAMKREGVDTIYVDPDAAQQLFQSGISPADLGLTDSAIESMATGGRVAIPIETFFTKLTTEQRKPLMDRARFTPSGMAPNEAEQFDEKAVDELLKGMQEDDSGRLADAEGNPAFDHILPEILATKRFNRGDSEKMAKLYERFITTLSKATKRDVPELVQQYPVSVLSDTIGDRLRRKSTAPVQQGLAPIIDALRTGKGPSDADIYGPSLTTFLKNSGGVQDYAGELAVMDAGKQVRGLVNPEGMTLDSALQAARDAGYIDAPLTNELDDYSNDAADINALLDLIREDLGGRPVHRNAEVNHDLLGFRRNVEEAGRILEDAGVDVTKASDQEIAAALMGDGGLEQAAGAAKTETPATPQTETPAFKKWFGDSKVVDEDGEPLVVYHGSNKDIHEFRPEFRESNSKARFADGYYFASNPKSAEHYAGDGAGANILPVYLSIKNPLRVDSVSAYRDVVFNYRNEGTAQEQARRAALRDSDVLQEIGYDGIVYSRNGDEEIVAFHPSQIKSATGNRGTFDPGNPSILKQPGSRGSILFPGAGFGEGAPSTIRFFESANWDTFAHEMGHFFLQVVHNEVSKGAADGRLTEDFGKLNSWFTEYAKTGDPEAQVRAAAKAATGEQADTLRAAVKLIDDGGPGYMESVAANFGADIQDPAVRMALVTPFHEYFARGFERYVGEGRAPSPELKPLFRRFKDWIVAVYRNLNNINVNLTDDVRGVMDRLLATDDEIAAARREQAYQPMLPLDEMRRMGLSEAKLREYADSLDRAKEKLGAKLMADLHRRDSAEWRRQLTATAKQVEAETRQDKAYQAIEILARGRSLTGEVLAPALEGLKLSRDDLYRRYGPAFVQERLLKHRVYATEGGTSLDYAAELLGYQSGDEMIRAIAAKDARGRYVRAEAQARMDERYPDALSDGTLPDRAKVAMHNTAMGRMLQAELDLLGELTGQPIPPRNVIRESARRHIATKTPRGLNPNQYLVQERKASRLATEAAVKGQYAQALVYKRQQAVNAALFAEARAATERLAKLDRLMKRMDRKASRESIASGGGEFLTQIDMIRHVYGYKPLSPQKVAARKPLDRFLDTLEEAGEVPAVSQRVLDSVAGVLMKNNRDTAIGELDEVDDAVRSLAHIAGQYKKVKRGKELVDHEQAVAELEAAALASLGEGDALPLTDRELSASQRLGKRARGVLQDSTRPETLVEFLDGGESGPWHDFILNAVNESNDAELVLKRRMGQKLKDIRKQMPDEFFRTLDEKVTVLGDLTIKRASLLSMVFNTGNKQNTQRLRDGGIDGRQLSDADVKDLREALTKDELRYVQATWNAVNSLWPDIVALHEKVSGVAPEKVEADPFTVTKDGETINMEGGYWPLAYDRLRSEVGEVQADADALRVMQGQGFTKAVTPKGYTKARAEQFSSPLLLDFAQVMSRHLDHAITDLSWRETAKNTSRLLRDPRIKKAIIARLGEGAYHNLRGSIVYAVSASSEVSGMTARDPRFWVNAALSNSAMAALSIRPDIALGNYAAGMVQAMDRTGVKALMRGMWETYTNRSAVNDAILSKSTAIASELQEWDRAYRVELQKTAGKRGYWEAYKRVMLTVHRWSNDEVVRAAWYGRYRDAIDAGKDEAEAVRLADKTIRQTQVARARKDLATIERDPAFQQFRMFMGPMFVILGRLNESMTGRGHRRDVGSRAVGIMLQVVFAPALFALAAGRWPNDKDKDDEIGTGDWAMWLAANCLLFPLQTLPILREAGSALESWITGNPINPRAAPTTQAVVSMFKGGKALAKDWEDYRDTGDLDFYDMTRDLIGAVGPVSGLPASQFKITSKSVEAIQKDEVPEDQSMASLLLYGPKK